MARFACTLLLTAGCTVDPEGNWVGACELPDEGARVRMWVYTLTDEAERERHVADAWVHLASRPDDVLRATCDPVELYLSEVTLDGCVGGWQSAGEPAAQVALTLHGEVGGDALGQTMRGDCRLEGEQGALELVKVP